MFCREKIKKIMEDNNKKIPETLAVPGIFLNLKMNLKN